MKRFLFKVAAFLFFFALVIIVVPMLYFSIAPDRNSVRSDNKSVLIFVQAEKKLLIRGGNHFFIGDYIKEWNFELP